jgi:hypothetical protein
MQEAVQLDKSAEPFEPHAAGVNQPPGASLRLAHSTDEAKERRLVELLDRCLAEMQAGRAIDRDALLAENSDLADELGDYLDSLQFISAFRGAD